MNWSVIPNIITISRVILLFPIALFLIKEEYTIAFYLFVVAGFSDALDGFLAKQFNWSSRFGAILDPLADKALLVITMAILTVNNEISWALFITVASRDVLIVVGAYFYHRRLGPYDMHPSYLSKFNTFIQITLVFVVLISLGYHQIHTQLLEILFLMTYATTIASGIHYGVVWGNKYRTEVKRLQNSVNENKGRE